MVIVEITICGQSVISKCEDRHVIALPEKFSHSLRKIIQSFYYAILKKTGMLHLREGKVVKFIVCFHLVLEGKLALELFWQSVSWDMH